MMKTGAEKIQSLKNMFRLAAGAGASTPAVALAATGSAALSVGAVTFSAPWVLLGLTTLPALWWLMRSVPPKPQFQDFPAMNILFNLTSEDQEPARMPLWQRILRLTAAGLVITGLAQPQWDSEGALEGEGPVVMVIDNGWSAARNWKARTDEMKAVIDRAESEDRKIIVLQTAPSQENGNVAATAPLDGAEARRLLLESKPQPWSVDRDAAADAVEALDLTARTSVVWLGNGLDDEGALRLAENLQKIGDLTVVQDDGNGARLLEPATPSPSDPVAVVIRRADGAKDDIATLTASDDAGRPLAQVQTVLKAGETEKRVEFDLTPEQRAQLMRVSIDGDNSAGAVALMDERWRRRPVGLVSAEGTLAGQSLLDEASYVDRALNPYVELRRGNVDQLLENDMAVMVMTDSVIPNRAMQDRLKKWVEDGGTLLRFAGPNMAIAGINKEDDLLPVELHPSVAGQQNGKAVRPLPFAKNSPFHDITIAEDVVAKGRILARPGVEMEDRVWARFEDGTPLVTGRREGNGWIVLVHTTAGPEWSNLALSGTFVDMMRAVVAHSRGISNDAKGPDISLPPIQVLDGTGKLVAAGENVESLTRGAVPGPKTPPGFYGNESMRQALNIASAVPELKPFPALPENVSAVTYETGRGQHDLAGPLLGGAMALLLIDLLILMGQRGILPRVRRTPQGSSAAPSPSKP